LPEAITMTFGVPPCYNDGMKMYEELAGWWPLLSSPGEYADEAALFNRLLTQAGTPPQNSLLELGCGGGNNASFLKATWSMTLTDVSPQMLAVSRALNPECRHVEGDMRTLRLNRLFDAVFVHDAVCYMTTEADLEAAITTAAVHCRPNGVALFAPDWVSETYTPGTHTGGHDGEDGRALRYLEWSHPVRPGDGTYAVDYAIVTREPGGETRSVLDSHLEGLFAADDWLRLLRAAGFAADVAISDEGRDIFIGVLKS
jgi:SAM-dependent methyltransferase